jgi:hypothetical protein
MKTAKTLFAAAALALALGAPGPAMAQGAMKDMMTKDHAMRASKLIGADVYNDQGDKIGVVRDLLARPGAEAQAVVNVGDYVGAARLVVIPVGSINLEGAKPTMKGATKGMLMALPVYAGDFGSG